jgi:hypothetical protein
MNAGLAFLGGKKMHAAHLAITILFVVMVVFSALGKIRHDPRQMRAFRFLAVNGAAG